MKHRGYLSKGERRARSRLAKLVHDSPVVRGSLVTMARRCGSPGCKCTKGEKHVSLYLCVRYDNRRKMIYVPKEWEDRVRGWVETHREIGQLLDILSRAAVDRLMKGKEKKP